MQTADRQSHIEELVEARLNEALPGALSLELRELSRELLSDGFTREELLDAYARIALKLRRAGYEEYEDDILEVMADLEGWGPPYAQI
ncbi:MAG: hypothetical protein ICV68_15750 [Pyrinomonadaceae bacterium]|nr:hypothetical protein [Pyrinomonadaceae bacterium]